jgi:hypothetical protein
MFHLSVSDSTSLPLCFYRASTSSLPPTTRPMPFTRVKPRISSPPQLEAGASHLEASQPLLPSLKHQSNSSFLSIPPITIATEKSSSEPFPSITPPVTNSARHHVHSRPAPLLIPSELPRAVPVGHTPSSSLILTRGGAVSPLYVAGAP